MHDYQSPDDLLDNKIILVTGAGDGIGRAVALLYAQLGATVVLLGKTEKKLNDVYDEIIDKGWPRPAVAPINLETVTDHDLNQLAGMLMDEFGRLDGLVHCAGVLGPITPIEKYKPELWQHVMQININAAYLVTFSLMPLLREAENASIIFSTSSVGRQGRAYWGAYAVSKFATEGLMQVLADELENVSDIRVNAVNPGATRTNMRAMAYPAEDAETLKTPEQITPLYVYLMGNDSLKVNGQSLDSQPK